MLVKINEAAIVEVLPSGDTWAISNKEVANAFLVSEQTIRDQKTRGVTEYIEDVHFTTVGNPHGGLEKTMWTKKGVILLGFKLRETPATIAFRDWAADFILNGGAKPQILHKPRISGGDISALVKHFGKEYALKVTSQAFGIDILEAKELARFEPDEHKSEFTIWEQAHIVVDDILETSLNELYANYLKYQKEKSPLSVESFSKALRRRFNLRGGDIRRRKDNDANGKWFRSVCGIGLRD